MNKPISVRKIILLVIAIPLLYIIAQLLAMFIFRTNLPYMPCGGSTMWHCTPGFYCDKQVDLDELILPGGYTGICKLQK